MPECFIECKHIFVGHVSLLRSTYMTFSVPQKLPCIVKFVIDVPEKNSSTKKSIPSIKVSQHIKLTATYSEQLLEESPYSVKGDS